MKLFIDDIRDAPDESWKLVRTITEAISAIDIFNFEVISIDHDISHQVQVGKTSRPYPCEETFLPIAVFLKEKYKTQLIAKEVGAVMTCLCKDGHKAGDIPKIILHTANPAGALRMKNVLDGFDVEIRESIPAYRNKTK